MLELTWHLCEVLFIEVLPTGCLVQQLLEWVRWHSGRSSHCVLYAVSVDYILLNIDKSLCSNKILIHKIECQYSIRSVVIYRVKRINQLSSLLHCC